MELTETPVFSDKERLAQAAAAYAERIRGSTEDLEVAVRQIYPELIRLPVEEQLTGPSDGWREFGCRHGWTYPQAADPKDVVGFSWGLWYVSLEGEAPGQGYWLTGLPAAAK